MYGLYNTNAWNEECGGVGDHIQPPYRNEPIAGKELDEILYVNRGAINETLYVEGVPIDATKREMAHIFRHFKGYKDLRLFLRKDKFTKKDFYLCFVDFDTPKNAYIALTTLQGYKMDLNCNEERGITLYFSKSKKVSKKVEGYY